MEERLQKIIALRGSVSRRGAEELIAQGHVKVNGRVAKLGDKADPEKDTITVRGNRIASGVDKVYIMLNKPLGYVTTMNDEKGRRTVAELVKETGARVYPVGRLDITSAGLLLMTNDGDFANAVTHPSNEKNKVYRTEVEGDITKGVEALQKPMVLDGKRLRKPEVRIVERRSEGGGILEITIHEGRYRQVRRMCDMAGMKVTALTRIRIGDIKLGNLKRGEWRYLTDEEIKSVLCSK